MFDSSYMALTSRKKRSIVLVAFGGINSMELTIRNNISSTFVLAILE